MSTISIAIKRIYEAASKEDGYRVLVDRLWPRGIKKADAAFEEWAKDLAPSGDLRKWFGHDPEKWPEFQRRYTAELKANDAIKTFIKTNGHRKKITLLYGAKDEVHNQAVVLQHYLISQFK